MKLPTDQDAELQVVGAMLVDPEMVVPVMEVLEADDFAYRSCRELYVAIGRLAGMGHDVDPLSVKNMLSADVSAIGRLADAIGTVTFPRHAVQHALRIKELAGLRRLASLGQDLVTYATTEGTSYSEAVEMAEKGIFGLHTNGYHAVDWGATTDVALARLEERYTADSIVTGLPFGLAGLDERLTGLHPGWLTIIGARPGEGKTSLALQAAVHIAEQGTPVMFVSLEMSATELSTRAISSRAGISYTKIRRGQLAESDWQKFVQASGEIGVLPLEMYDEGVETVAQVRARARRSRPGLVVVDYLQLMRPDTPQARRDLDIAEITRGLKLLAREQGIPVLACAQLNRGQLQKDGSIRAPELQDLRDSGSQEQDADVVILLHRKEKDPRVTQALVRKFRHGPTGTDELYWYPDITRFADGLR